MTFPLDHDDPPPPPGAWLPLTIRPAGKLLEFRVRVRDADGVDQGERYAFVHVTEDEAAASFEQESPPRLRVVAGRWRAHEAVWTEAHEIRHLPRDQIAPVFTANVDDWPSA